MEVEKTFQEQFQDAIKREGRTQNWLADQMGLSYITISKILTEAIPLTERNRKKLNELLGTHIGDSSL